MSGMEFMGAAIVRVAPNSTAVKVGCAVLAITIALVWGLVKTGQRLKEGEANRKCLLSYIFLTTGWLLHAAIAAITFQTSRPEAGSIVAMVVFFGFGLAGVTLAILGLSEVRQSPDLLKVGRGTAILTLVLSGAFAALFVAALGLGVLRGMERSAKTLAPPGAIAIFEDFGFSIKPPSPWVRVDVSKESPNVTIAFHRTGPEGIIMIVVERIPAGGSLDYESMARSVRDNLGRVSKGFKIVDEADEMINLLPGRRLICECDIQGERKTNVYWHHISREFVYQLGASSDTRDASVIVPDARKAFATFELIRPK